MSTQGRKRRRIETLLRAEEERFVVEHPRSHSLSRRARDSLLGGVPMSWMLKWPGQFPVFLERAAGARMVDVDGREYVDFCLGDTAAMAGHVPPSVSRVLHERAMLGLTAMLPTEDSLWVGEELERRFGLPAWQFTLTATDANRFVLRLARAVTSRPKVLVFDYCYHGTLDESIITGRDGVAGSRPGNIGPPIDPAATTRVVEFNDVDGLERELAYEDVACVLAEPAMTNIGIVLPAPGFHEALRAATRRHGTLLALDETHTFSAGPGGMTGRDRLKPDIVTIGKAIGGGVPAAAFGLSQELAQRIASLRILPSREASGGVGGTLAGSALSIAAIRATLAHVLNAAAFDYTIPLAEDFARGVEETIRGYGLGWHVTQLGCRAEYRYRPAPPHSGREAVEGSDDLLDRFLHIFALNRGVLMTPFHSMALISPATVPADIARHHEVFAEAVDLLTR